MGKNSGGVGTSNGGGTATSQARNAAAKDDVLTGRTFTLDDLLANDPGSARNLTFLDDHVVDNGDGTFTVAAGQESFAYKVQMANGTWSEASVTAPPPEPVLVQFLENFSFEADPAPNIVTGFNQITGWTNVSGGVLEVVRWDGYNIGGDGHWLDSQSSPGGITISQDVDVGAGEAATLTVNVAKVLSGGGLHPGSTLTFTFNGDVVLSLTEADFAAWNQLTAYSVEVTGQAGADTLVISDNGTGLVGYAIDWVKLEGWVV